VFAAPGIQSGAGRRQHRGGSRDPQGPARGGWVRNLENKAITAEVRAPSTVPRRHTRCRRLYHPQTSMKQNTDQEFAQGWDYNLRAALTRAPTTGARRRGGDGEGEPRPMLKQRTVATQTSDVCSGCRCRSTLTVGRVEPYNGHSRRRGPADLPRAKHPQGGPGR